MGDGPKRMAELGPYEIVVDRTELMVSIRRLDAARLFLYRELVKADTAPVERGDDSMGDWCTRNRDEHCWAGTTPHQLDLLTAFEMVWGVGERIAAAINEPFLSMDQLKSEGSHLLPSSLSSESPLG